jgi:hypothetical protein
MKRIVIVTNPRDGRGNKANGIRVGEALAGLGHSVALASHDQAARGAGLEGADLALLFGTVVSDEAKRPGLFSKIRAQVKPTTVLALWYFDLCCPGMKNSPWKNTTVRRMAPRLDWLFMTDHSHAWEKHTRNFRHLAQGIDPAEFAKAPAPHFSRLRDVIFTGGTRPPFQDREKALAGLRRRFSVAVYGRDAAQTAFGEAFWREHQRSRVVFVPKPPSWAPCRYWSNRIYLATATGTPAVAGWTEGLEGHFQDGRDLLFYRTQQELESAIDLLLSDTEARIRIGTAGRRRTLEDHTYAKRSAELMAAIFGRNP